MLGEAFRSCKLVKVGGKMKKGKYGRILQENLLVSATDLRLGQS